MAAGGVFDDLGDRRVELVRGKIFEVPIPSPDHSETVTRLCDWSVSAYSAQTIKLRVHGAIALPEFDSAPEPDVVWSQFRSYRDRNPLAGEVRLVIEVADSSLDYDCSTKAELYAAAGIQDYWVVSLPERLVHVYRQPEQGTYREHTTVGMGSTVRPLALPEFELSVSELLGP